MVFYFIKTVIDDTGLPFWQQVFLVDGFDFWQEVSLPMIGRES